MNNSNTKSIKLFLPKEIMDWLIKESEKRELSISQIIRETINKEINK